MDDMKKNGPMEPLDIPESEIPWYRMRWFFIVTLLLCFPVMIIIGLTGNVYGREKGRAFKLSNSIKYMVVAVGSILMVGQIIRIFL